MKKKVILSSLLVIVLCMSLITGATFALFTSTAQVNVAITSANVKVTATATIEKTMSFDNEYGLDTATESYPFENGGYAKLNDDGSITVDRMSCGDAVYINIAIDNASDIKTLYNVQVSTADDTGLFAGLNATVDGTKLIKDAVFRTPYMSLAAGEDPENIKLVIELPDTGTAADNDYQGKACKLLVAVNVVQGNAPELISIWDGTASDDWYNTTDKQFTLSSAADLAGLAELVNAGNSFSGKTITLDRNLDLNGMEWTPIGTGEKAFSGTFDGNGYVISNLAIAPSSRSNVGLFGMTTNGEIKNLGLDNASVGGYLNVGAVSGTPYTSKFTNITLTGDIKVEGFSYVGAVGGKNAYANFTNVTIDANPGSYVKANSVSGSTAYRTYVGGVVGFMGEGSHKFENVHSNIDVYGSTCDIGGIVGIAHYGNSFVNCSSSGNVYIADANENEVGGIAGVWNNTNGYTVTFTGCEYTGTIFLGDETSSTPYTAVTYGGLVGPAYSSTGTGKLIIDGVDMTNSSWDGAVSTAWYDAAGSSFTLNNASDIAGLAKLVNEGNDFAGKTVTLSANLDLNGKTWTEIGAGARSGNTATGGFAGTFNGNNKTVSGLVIDGGADDAIGFFGVVTGTVKNLKIDNSSINSAANKNAGLVAGLVVGGTIENCSTSASCSVTAPDGVGGLVGRVLADGDVINCTNNATVTATASGGAAGGVIGKAYYTVEGKEMNITNCTNNGVVNAVYAAGGIVGLSAANVKNCTNNAAVTATGVEAGGIIAEQVNYGEVSGNKNTAMINAGGFAGGIIGWVRYQNNASYAVSEVIVISGNENSADIISSGSSAGGIVGHIYNQATVSGNKNTCATVSAKTFAAGIVGALQRDTNNLEISGAQILVSGNEYSAATAILNANCTHAVAYNNEPSGTAFVVENNTAI